uniref:ABC transporter domain-containing protein n=1 Tax=Acrobeloides nanus TaxID=290746 RepID=A0A914DTF3_9BILA
MLLVDEDASHSKHLQKVFGVSPWMYWVTNFLCDFAIYFICSLLIICIYYLMNVELFTFSWQTVGSAILVFVLYGCCTLPFVYIMQMFFKIPALAFALISIGIFFVGVVTTMTVMLLENLQTGDESLDTAHRICSGVFLLVPQYNLGMAMYRLSFVYTIYDYGRSYLEKIGRLDALHELPLPNVMEWEMIGKHCLALFLGSLLYMALLALVEYRDVVFKFIRNLEKRKTLQLVQKNELDRKLDEDVMQEQKDVENIDDFDEYGLVVKGLSKSYSGKALAVNNLSFSVRKGQCFGLLGVNGAGKTTTFSMLTKRLGIGSGDALIHGMSINDSKLPRYRLLGYCPQFDALNLKLTAREQLAFYCRIRGICEKDIDKVVDWAVQHMQLKPYANEVSGSYSGGNKRKLSAAISVCADPPVVLLDEPSSGMDPSSQQFMWDLILNLRRSNRTVIITSHSMEECEALCTKTAIMVNGQFECIGSIQHLKQKYGIGYTFTLKLSAISDVEQAKNFIEENIPNAELQSIHCSSIFYQIKDPKFKLSHAFQTVAMLKKLVSVEDYSLSQTTLDDVFVSFASKSNADIIEMHENENIVT